MQSRPRSTRRRTIVVAAAVMLAGSVLPGSAAAAAVEPAPHPLTVADLTTERAIEPIGLDVARPRLGWTISSSGRGVVQQAYQIRVATDPDRLTSGDPDVWDSGR